MRNVTVVDDDGVIHPVLFTDDAAKNVRIEGAQKLLLKSYQSAGAVRAQVPYAKAPGLTKAVMRTPFGIDGAGYSFTSEAVNKPATLSDAAMEAMLKAAMSVEFGTPEEDVALHAAFLDPTSLGMAAVKFAENVASALSTVAAGIMPYRADGRTALLPDKLVTFPSEFWSAEGTRTDASGDCDDSAAFTTAFVHRTRELFATSTSAKSKYPYLYGLHRTLAHHEVAIAVLFASAANADAADEGEGSGHAMTLLVPKLHLWKALDRGARVVGVPKATEARVGEEEEIQPVPAGASPHLLSGLAFSEEQLASLRAKTLDALYPEGGIPIDAEESRIIQGGWDEIMDKGDRFASLTTLAVEGTSAAFSRLCTPDAGERAEAYRQACLEKKAAMMLSPTIGVTLKRLDATESGRHAFYNSFIELIFATNSPLLRSRALQEAGAATAHVVLATPTTDGTLDGGVRPEQLARNDFAAVPLSTFSRAEVDVLQEAWEDVASNTIGRAATPIVLGKDNCVNLEEARTVFATLDAKLRAVELEETADVVEVNIVFTPTGLIHNAGCTQLFAELVDGVFKVPVSGSATLHAIPDIAVDGTGKQMGAFGTVRILVPHSALS